MAPSTGTAAGPGDGVMGDEDARPAVEAGEQLLQPPQLRPPDRPAGVPGPAVGRRRVDRHQPDVPDALGERVDLVTDPLAHLPGGEVPLEVPREHGAAGAVVVVARYSEAWL